MEIKLTILLIGVVLLISYLVFINRREKSLVHQQNSKIPSQSSSSDISTLSIKFPTQSNKEEFESFLEKRKLEIFREILRRDHIAKQKRQINKATCLREILDQILGVQGAAGVFEYYGSVELFSDIYIKYFGHIPDKVILKCFDNHQLWEPKIEIYEQIKQAILNGSLKTIETPKESDIWIVSIYPDSLEKWLKKNKESIEAPLKKIGQQLPSFD